MRHEMLGNFHFKKILKFIEEFKKTTDLEPQTKLKMI